MARHLKHCKVKSEKRKKEAAGLDYRQMLEAGICPCPTCHRRFARKRNCRKHLMEVHCTVPVWPFLKPSDKPWSPRVLTDTDEETIQPVKASIRREDYFS